jgi:hypothetical protein
VSGLFVFFGGLLIGIAAYVAAMRVANGRLDAETVRTWFPDGSEDEGGESCGD